MKKAAVGLGDFAFDWTISGTADRVRVTLSNGTLHGVVGAEAASSVATVRCERSVIDRLVADGASLRAVVAEGAATIDGDGDRVLALWDLLVDFPMFFAIVEP